MLPTRGRVQIATLPATDDHGGRKVWIYRPGVPDSSALPVVYFLHGLPGSYLDLATLGVQDTLDQLITRGKLPPFVLAVPDGNSTNAADPEWADSASHSLTLEDFVIGPVRRLVEGNHPRNRAHRSIMGFSMGGYGAMNIALQHPEIYGSVAALAGYFDTDDESGVFDHDPTLLARNSPDHNLDAAHQLRIMLADGARDTLSVTKGETQRFASLLRASGVTPWVDIQPGTHSASYLQAELPRAFAFLLEGRT
ncbi:MAG TPA: alpha/beta hydrolase-fold protein [Mycobacteriales bacterium]|nr:alpha/beta hydrolase-fold protein [Mycobacteriales bacterium]